MAKKQKAPAEMPVYRWRAMTDFGQNRYNLTLTQVTGEGTQDLFRWHLLHLRIVLCYRHDKAAAAGVDEEHMIGRMQADADEYCGHILRIEGAVYTAKITRRYGPLDKLEV